MRLLIALALIATMSACAVDAPQKDCKDATAARTGDARGTKIEDNCES